MPVNVTKSFQCLYFANKFAYIPNLKCSSCGRPYLLKPYYGRRFSSTQCNVERQQVQPKWQSVVGLEIHAQIKSASKLFSGAATDFGGIPNTQVSLFDAAIPGTLPVLNKKCVEAAALTAQALNCNINRVSKFDRKHYFYADMPAGYQITQHRQPLATGGELTYVFQCSQTSAVERRSARLIQIQLEQDSGKSLHDIENKVSLIDLNRAGVGLMEIVTSPDFIGGDDAASFVRDLRDLLVALDTCDGRMAEGSLRVDANVSVHRPGEPWGVRTEVKNLNSTRSIRLAIDSEIDRHIGLLEAGGVVENETRSFDVEEGQTVQMREKEKILDYRFMPEPNLPPVMIDIESFTRTKPSQFILPDARRRKLEEKFGVPLMHSVVLARQNLDVLFENLVEVHGCEVWAATAVLKTPYAAFLDEQGVRWHESPVSVEQLAELIHILQRGEITSASLSVVLKDLAINPNFSCESIVQEKGLWVVDNQDVISAAIDDILSRNPQNVKAYKKGKTNQLKVFTSKVIKLLEGKANAAHVQKLIKDTLDK